jgi:hypothetical protein
MNGKELTAISCANVKYLLDAVSNEKISLDSQDLPRDVCISEFTPPDLFVV